MNSVMRSLCCAALIGAFLWVPMVGGQETESARSSSSPARGPLRVHPTNPRYFTDGVRGPGGVLRAVYLTGSFTWPTMQDWGPADPPAGFDYDAFLNQLRAWGHNYFRMFRFELTRERFEPKTAAYYGLSEWMHCAPHPWKRVGPGLARDGKPRFDLNRFDEDYFRRLRSRVQAAQAGGIYVGIMLFEGWHLKGSPQSWSYHPFHRENNVNGVDADANGNGQGEEVHSLKVPAVWEVQRAYLRKVVETVNDLDNVIFETANESAVSGSAEWQYEIIREIKRLEAAFPKQHPVGMGSQAWDQLANHEILWRHPGEWTSVGAATGYDKATDPHVSDPPAADGRKVSILDTDHLGWMRYLDDAPFARAWVWKAFTRGHNPILMENLANHPGWEAARAAMGQTRSYAARINMAAMTPHEALSTTRYCLAAPGREYVVFEPDGGEFAVQLPMGRYGVEWFNPQTAAATTAEPIQHSGGKVSFTPPFVGAAVLYLQRSDAPSASQGSTGTSREAKPRTIRVAAAQAEGRVIDFRLTPDKALAAVDRNLAALESIVERAGGERCDVLVFPEDTMGLLNWIGMNEPSEKQVLPAAVQRMLERLGRAAARHRMYLVVCSDHLEVDGGLYNTAFLLGRDGRELGRYHKTCPTWPEGATRRSGTKLPVFPTPDLGTADMLICYDLVMPETARTLALQGADIIFFPTLGGAAIGDGDIGVQALRVRAVENFVYLVVAHRGSGAMIISPQGKILAEAKGADGLAIADIDPHGGREGGDASNWQRDMRARLFRERNPAAFAPLVDPEPAVLEKAPVTLSREEAGRIMARMLTIGEEEFNRASTLARGARTNEAIAAFEKLSRDYRDSWIDRAAREQIEKLRSNGAENSR